jgi:hypothetical protein
MEPLQQAVTNAEKHRPANLSKRHRRRLLVLALLYIPAVHKLVDIPESLTRRVVACRKKLIVKISFDIRKFLQQVASQFLDDPTLHLPNSLPRNTVFIPEGLQRSRSDGECAAFEDLFFPEIESFLELTGVLPQQRLQLVFNYFILGRRR